MKKQQSFVVKVKFFIINLFKNLKYILEQKKSIKELYNPIIQQKNNKNKQLEKKLNYLKAENLKVYNEINTIQSENQNIEKKISILETLLVNDSFHYN